MAFNLIHTAAVFTSVVIIGCLAQPTIDGDAIVAFMNQVRSSVSPPASNMRVLTWNTELADFAQSHADGCSLEENPIKMTTSYMLIGESRNVSTDVTDSSMYVQDVLNAWVDTGIYYDFDENICSSTLCELYTQLVWAETLHVGCGVNVCPNSDGTYFFVCNFHPAGNVFGRRPYIAGDACTGCSSSEFCDNDNFCVEDDSPDMMTGSDPHFSVRLPSGQLLCFTVQGEVGMNFNLISTDELEMNAQFIVLPSRPRNTWLGAIGITVNTGKQLVFNATDGTIRIDNKMIMNSSTVQRMRIANGQLYLTEGVSGSITNQVEVDIEDLDLLFTVVFVRNRHSMECEHLDMLWNSGGMDKQNIHGLLGQFLRSGVIIDEENQLLILPGRPSVPVVHQKLFAFIRAEAPEYKAKSCWTAVKRSNQGEGVIEGIYPDYEVNSILSTGFKFGVSTNEDNL